MDEKTRPSLRDLLYVSAESMKRALPSYEELTVADITVGIASVAVEHKKQHVSRNAHSNPFLVSMEEYFMDDTPQTLLNFKHTINPDKIDPRKFILANYLLPYANWVYYPIIEHEGKHLIVMQSDDTTLPIAETLTKKKEHRLLRLVPGPKLIQYECVSDVMKQAYFITLDTDLEALVISVRGTDSIMDVFTNFTAEPATVELHTHYSLNPETIEERTIGQVHGGKLMGAKWILSEITGILEKYFFIRKEKYKHVRTIFTTGHSLGGAVATLLAIVIREYMIEHRNELPDDELPDVRTVTFSPSAFMSENLSWWCKSFVDSLIVGCDIVPRFAVGQAERLRDEINQTDYPQIVDFYLQEHKRITSMIVKFNGYLSTRGHNPLMKSFTSTQEDCFFEEPAKEKNYDINPLYPPGNLIWFSEEKRVRKEKDFYKVLFEFVEQKLAKEDSEYTPGKLVSKYFEDKKQKQAQAPQKKKRKFIVRQVAPKHFDRIILTRRMFSDHKLLKFFDLLKIVNNQIGGKEPKCFLYESIEINEDYFV